MADPTTLLEYAERRKTDAQSASASAQTAVVNAQTAVQTARDALASATAAAAALASQIAQKRGALADAPPADMAALTAEITALTIQWRTAQGTLLQRGDDLASAQADSDLARADLTRATARLADASAAYDGAVAQDAMRQGWKTALAGPLGTLHDDAGTALTEDPYNAAAARIGALPAKLTDAAAAAYAAAAAELESLRGEVEAAEDTLGKHYRTKHGVAGAVEDKRIAFERAAERVRDYATLDGSRYQSALATLTALAAAPLLTADETTAISDAGKEAAREAAADLMTARETKRQAADEAQTEYDNTLVDKQADNPGADVSGDTDVTAAEGALTTANGDLSSAEGDYAAKADDFRGWTAVVPDAAWQRIRAFYAAQGTLQALSTGRTAAQLSSDLDSAEAALVTALLALGPDLWAEDYLADALARREARLARAGSTLQDRLLSAMRGDA